MVNWKTSIRPIYIPNQDLYKLVCEINTQSGTIIEKERSELPDIETWRGFYKNTDTGLIGVFLQVLVRCYLLIMIHILL